MGMHVWTKLKYVSRIPTNACTGQVALWLGSCWQLSLLWSWPALIQSNGVHGEACIPQPTSLSLRLLLPCLVCLAQAAQRCWNPDHTRPKRRMDSWCHSILKAFMPPPNRVPHPWVLSHTMRVPWCNLTFWKTETTIYRHPWWYTSRYNTIMDKESTTNN